MFGKEETGKQSKLGLICFSLLIVYLLQEIEMHPYKLDVGLIKVAIKG